MPAHQRTDGDAIIAEDLVKEYRGRGRRPAVRALDGLSFAVPAGRVFGLLGPNGAGKSTTTKILTTLSRPTAGRARVAGHDVNEAPADVRAAIGYVSRAPERIRTSPRPRTSRSPHACGASAAPMPERAPHGS